MNRLKSVLLGCMLCVIAATGYTQNMSGLFVAPVVPVGNLSAISNVGAAIGGHSRFFPIERLAAGFNVSCQYYFGKNGFNGFVILPIRGTVEYWFKDEGAKYRPYAGLDLGLYLTTYSNSVDFNFGLAPGAGVSIELSDRISVQVQSKYNFIFSSAVMMAVEPAVGFTYTFY